MSDAIEHPGDNRPAAYWELDGNIVQPDAVYGPGEFPGLMVVRASALGRCQWELAAMLQGHTPEPVPPAIQLAFDAGHIIEPYVLERLYGPDLRWERDEGAAQAQGELVVGKGRVVRFHPDDVATSHLDGVKRIVEVKALSSANWQQARVKGPHSLGYGYDWQLSAQMIALRLPAVYVLLEKPDGFNPTAFDPDVLRKANLAMVYVDTPPHSRVEIVKRVAEIYEVAMGEDLATSGRPCDRPEQWPCAFRHLRPEPEGDTLPTVPDSQVDEFKVLVTRYQGANRIIKTQTEVRDQARAALLELAEEARLAPADPKPGEPTNGGMRNEHYRVRINRSVGSKIDKAAMKADGVLDKYQVVGNERTTVTVEDV